MFLGRIGKSADNKRILIVHKDFGQSDNTLKNLQEKSLSFRHIRPVPQTDTGGQEENSKVLERFTAKELGKMVL